MMQRHGNNHYQKWTNCIPVSNRFADIAALTGEELPLKNVGSEK